MMLNKNFLALGAILLVILVASGVGVWYFFFTPKEKAVTGLSYYDFPLTIKVNDEVKEIDPYGNYSFLVTTDEPITFGAYDTEGGVILEKVYAVDRQAAIIIEVLTPEEEVAENSTCIAKATVTDVYYVDPELQVADDFVANISNVEILQDQPTLSYTFTFGEFGSISERDVFPGRYSIDDLPDTITENQQVTGYFPVVCDKLDDDSSIRDQVYVWRYFEEGGFDDFDWDSLLDEDYQLGDENSKDDSIVPEQEI